MRHLAGYPRFFYPLLLIIFIGLCVSGILLIPHFFSFRLDQEPPFDVTSEIRLYSAVLHTLTAFLTLAVIGALASVHMRAGWVRKENRWSGSLLVINFLILLVTAIIIFYSGDENWSVNASSIHTLIGLFVGGLFTWHCVHGLIIHKRRAHKRHTH